MRFFVSFLLTFIIFSSIFIAFFVFRYLKKQSDIKDAHLCPDLDTLFEFTDDILDAHSHAHIIDYIRLFEEAAATNVLFLDYNANRLVYVDWNVFKPIQVQKIEKEFKYVRDGYAFFDSDLNRSAKRYAAGFVLKSNGNCLVVFFKHIQKGENAFWEYIYTAFKDFVFRCALIDDFLNRTLFSRQLFDIEKMQYSFLPRELPKIKGIETSSYFLPLITVSGDYYTVIPITETKTLLLLGDVSGKGLSAALVMGVIMSAVQLYEQKEDLIGLMSQIDYAVKLMRLGDKFTVVFSAVVDTESMQMHYINASLADSYILSKKNGKKQIKTLPSTCSLIGVEGLSSITAESLQTITLVNDDSIVLTSDGLSDVGHSTGTSFGDTQLYKDLLLSSIEKPLDVSVKQLADNAMKFSQTTALKDDITILALRVVAL